MTPEIQRESITESCDLEPSFLSDCQIEVIVYARLSHEGDLG